MTAAVAAWRYPLVTFDAAACLPPAVDSAPPNLTSFGAAAVALLDDLTSGLVPTMELTDRLRRLGNLAFSHSLAFPRTPPTALASARAIEQHSLGLRHNEVDERIRYDEFFGIRREPALQHKSLSNAIFVTLANVMHDLADTQLGIHEITALLRGAIGATAWIGEIETLETGEFAPAETPSALSRFRLGHVLFALMCNFGAHHIRNATQPSGEINPDRLTTAALFVRASTAAMWYSIGFPQESYACEVRPLMDAASTKDHGFSGLDNFDFRRMREAWEDLAQTLAVRLSGLSAGSREDARKLYETIVEDNEHHILIAAAMVGMLPSLKYERLATRSGISYISAVSALRVNADERRMLVENLFEN